MSAIELRNARQAVAMSLLGFHCFPRSYYRERDGVETLAWFAKGRDPKLAVSLISLLDLPANDPRHLNQVHPEHPFLIMLYAQEAADNLRHWMRHPHDTPAVIRPNPRGRLLRVVRQGSGTPVDLMPHFATMPPVATIAQIDHAAATIVGAGWVPLPALLSAANSQPAFHFPAASATHPELQLAMLPHADRAPLPGPWPPNATHPFLWCLAALRKARRIPAIEAAALRDPAVLWHGTGQRRALVTQSLFDRSASLRDRLQPHLAGLT